MALNFNGTKNSQPANQKPSGYTNPSVTEFTDWESYSPLVLLVAKSTVANATKSTTLTNIYDDATVGINKQITDILTADYDTTGNTVDAWADCTYIDNNQFNTTDTDFYTDTAVSYKCVVTLYVKTS